MMAVNSKQREFSMRPLWVVMVFYAVGLADLPYGYYMITRLVTCLIAVRLIWQLHLAGSGATPFAWLLGAVAILYNPIAPVYLYSKTLWLIANGVTLGIFWSAIRVGQRVSMDRANSDMADTGS